MTQGKGNKSKYLGWGNFLKTRRESRFRSARELCKQVSLGISYPQYSRYEAGDQLPSLEQALSLAAILGVPPLETVLHWSLAQVPEREASVREQLSRLLDEARAPGLNRVGAPQTDPRRGVALDDVIVFNRSHLKVFASDPVYRDIFTYVNSFGPEWIDAAEIVQALGIGTERALALLMQLSELGVIELDSGSARCRATKRIFYFPDDEDFFGLRNFNFRNDAERVLDRLKHSDLTSKKAYRSLVSRELTADQVKLVIASLDQALAQVVAMPETADARSVYSLCMLLGERFSRASHDSVVVDAREDVAPGLKVETELKPPPSGLQSETS